MRMYDIINRKRLGCELTAEELAYFVKGVTAGAVPDYMTTALLMAICINGMTAKETVMLTRFMEKSGDTLDLSAFGNLTADKHSTGGVGDKTTLIAAPVAAALGCKVAKMSGRGLGHTGGTVDKLESIPGYRTSLSEEEFLSQVEKTGIAVIGQTGNMAPADKKLYALRDVTATVDSLPLITSSIMSKKLAAGSKNIVLDVKTGSGAFMKTPEKAKELASAMVQIAKQADRNCRALITDMDTPLGVNIGNALEIEEAVDILSKGVKNDLYEVSLALASNMASMALGIGYEEARRKAETVTEDGTAFAKMKEWIAAQGGDTSVLDDTSLLPKAAYSKDVFCRFDGYISHTDAEKIGLVAVSLGAGRKTKTDTIDHAAGIKLYKKAGDAVKTGDRLCTLYANSVDLLKRAEDDMLSAVKFSLEPCEKTPLIYETVM